MFMSEDKIKIKFLLLYDTYKSNWFEFLCPEKTTVICLLSLNKSRKLYLNLLIDKLFKNYIRYTWVI